MESNKQASWYYKKEGKQVGPVAAEEIKVQVETEMLSYGDMVWRKGSLAWVKLEDSDLKHLLADQPPPLSTKKVTNMPMWAVWGAISVAVIYCVVIGIIGMADTGSIAERLGKYHSEVDGTDRFNAGVGKALTFGFSPEWGHKMMACINPGESKERIALGRRGRFDDKALLAYTKGYSSVEEMEAKEKK